MGACTSAHVDPQQQGAPEPMVIRVQSTSARAATALNKQQQQQQQPAAAKKLPQSKVPTLRARPSSGESGDSCKEDESYETGSIEKTTRLGSLGSSSGSSNASMATSTQSDSAGRKHPTMSTLTPSDKSNASPPHLHLPSHNSAPGPSRPHSLHVDAPSGSPILTAREGSPTNVSPLHVRPMLSAVPSGTPKRESALELPNSRGSVDLATLLPNSSPRRKDGLAVVNERSPALLREPTPTVHTTHIERGITEDGFYHINQYIIEMGRWKREAMKRQSDRALRRAERIADRARREADGGINHEASEDDSSDESDLDPEESGEEDEDEEATILGRGSYGVVKKVFNTQDGQFYAMKIMSKSLLGNARAFGRQAGDGDGIDGIRREIAIMKKLDHPNIVKLTEVLYDDDSDNVMLVMEFAEGGCIMPLDLDEGEVEFEDGSVNIVSDPLPVETARQYLHDILSGLAYLHHQKVIHRDIKPENLLLSSKEGGRVMIADFGVSTLCEGDECMISSTAGTACFMSPEMIKSGARNRGFGGPQTDIWSVGVTLFFMLYGRLPWYSKSLPEIYRSICEDPLVFPSGLQFAHIPVQAQTLIRFMLDKNPATRATTACMLQCPWVTNGFTWNLETHCKALASQGFPDAIEYQHKPLVEATVCNAEIQHAMSTGKVVKEGSSPIASPRENKCPIFARMKSRLAAWKKEMTVRCEQRCAAKKAERARKRATMDAAAMSSSIANAQKEAIASRKNPRRSTAAPGSSYNVDQVISFSDAKELALFLKP